ncbi:MAG: phosphohydrolase, partial [Sphingobacteriaceae bacterium]|nr:phosphohydrolase [Cytophagaceae bacterium]
IKMMDVLDNQLVIEQKGVYSIENFLTSRRLMYWQVYLHKTSICAETMLVQIIRRARELCQNGAQVYATPALELFLHGEVTLDEFRDDPQVLEAFTQLDDYDLWGAIKQWAHHPDRILRGLSRMLLERKLFKITLSNQPIETSVINLLRRDLRGQPGVTEADLSYLLVEGSTTNAAYVSNNRQNICILTKDQRVVDIAEASDLPTIQALSKIVRKYYVCWAKTVYLQL